MTVDIDNFGEVLISRPAGKEAFLMAKAYIFNNLNNSEPIVLNFEKVKVLTPSWIDEFITGIKSSFTNKIEYKNTNNESVFASLETVLN